jgi:lactate dehydrogenase-like 2-hydroxyacid dehydrogenase
MTKKPRLWITRRLSDKTLERADRDYECVVNFDDRLYSTDELIEGSAQFDAILPCHSETFRGAMLDKLGTRLKIIANHSVGVDHCDIPALKERGISVTNTPDVLSEATAELTFLLMLGAARRAVEGDTLVRNGQWDFWSPAFMVGKQVSGARLGIVGMGRVGQVLAKQARGFNMQVHYYSRHRLPPEMEAGAHYHSSLDSLLPVSDFLSLHCPATPETTGFMTAYRFAQLPDGAVFVNAARGALVDEDALISAIERGKLSGAGLDCFVVEPGGNPKLSKFQNVFMLPHIGSATRETRDAMGYRALDNLDAYFAGQTPKDLL